MREESLGDRRLSALRSIALAGLIAGIGWATAAAGPSPRPWADNQLSPDRRAQLALRAMTPAEKRRLVFGYYGAPKPGTSYRPPSGARMGEAGYVPGIPRLGIPPQWISDGGLGVATQRVSTDAYRERTALPSGLATAATWNPSLAERGGAMIGAEAHASGFNVLLGPGADLIREARGGRSFEYASEDPLLTGMIAGAEIRGIQSQHVIAVLKHFAFNDQETGRASYDVRIPQAAARESDLLGFEIAMEQGHPGALMCAYNRVQGHYACENRWLLRQVLDRDFGYRGYVMSDWGAVHSTVRAALAGLDQESAAIYDREPYYGAALRKALHDGRLPGAVLDTMAERILRSMFATGVVDHPVAAGARLDFDADRAVAETDEQQGIVLLKNTAAVLPFPRTLQRIAVIGGHADRGVLSGGGSSTVFPVGDNAVPGLGPSGWFGPQVYLPSAPLGALMGQTPQARFRYASGRNLGHAVAIAHWANRVIVFATQWATESEDASLTLRHGQDRLIAAVAAANPKTVIVLETGGPVLMPWLDRVAGVLEAWYPGSGGATAIAGVVFGSVDPSGHLPVTFPASVADLPFRTLPGAGLPPNQAFVIDYAHEGAAVGYRWYRRQRLEPLFPFGYGLSYTHFDYGGLSAQLVHGALVVQFTVRNTGLRPGAAVAQVYVEPEEGGSDTPRRLAGWRKLALRPGESRTVSVRVDPRLLARIDRRGRRWVRAAGAYRLWLGDSSAHLVQSVSVDLPAWQHSVRWPIAYRTPVPSLARRTH